MNEYEINLENCSIVSGDRRIRGGVLYIMFKTTKGVRRQSVKKVFVLST